jgi:hypothetical protein
MRHEAGTSLLLLQVDERASGLLRTLPLFDVVDKCVRARPCFAAGTRGWRTERTHGYRAAPRAGW